MRRGGRKDMNCGTCIYTHTEKHTKTIMCDMYDVYINIANLDKECCSAWKGEYSEGDKELIQALNRMLSNPGELSIINEYDTPQKLQGILQPSQKYIGLEKR